MIPVLNEKKYPPELVKKAREYCETVGAVEIYNIAVLGAGDWRIMYHISNEKDRKMQAVVLQLN